MGPVAAAVAARPMRWEGGLHVGRGLSHLQKLVSAFQPQQEGHTPKCPLAQQFRLQAGCDPGHRRGREPRRGQGLCRGSRGGGRFCGTWGTGVAQPDLALHAHVSATREMGGIAGGDGVRNSRKSVAGSVLGLSQALSEDSLIHSSQASGVSRNILLTLQMRKQGQRCQVTRQSPPCQKSGARRARSGGLRPPQQPRPHCLTAP